MVKKFRIRIDTTKKFRVRIRERYFKENWGAPFIIGFMMLLMVAIGSLITDSIQLAESIANYAYYALVVGVVLQIAGFLNNGRKKGGP